MKKIKAKEYNFKGTLKFKASSKADIMNMRITFAEAMEAFQRWHWFKYKKKRKVEYKFEEIKHPTKERNQR